MKKTVVLISALALLLSLVLAASASADEADEVSAIAVSDALNRTESPLANGTNWTALGWAEGTVKPGRDTTSGWGPSNASPTINGAYWFAQTSDAGGGDAAGLTVNVGPGGGERYVSVWLNMPNPGSVKSGYQLRWTWTGENIYTVKLSKWVSGTETVLASKASVSIPSGTRMMISDNGETITAWKGTSSPLSPLLTATDSTYTFGFGGIEGVGNISRSLDFRLKSYSKEKILALPLRDDMQRSESPLSFGGKWTKTGAAESIGAAWTNYSKLGYASTGSSTFSSAYWNPQTFSDSGEGEGVAVTVNSGGASGQWMAISLNGSNLGSSSTQNKYELRWTGTGTANNYTLELSKVAAGTRTVLTGRSATIEPGQTVALTEKQGSLFAWAGNPPAPMLVANDSSFTSGYAGISGYGLNPSAYNFQAGPLEVPKARTYWGAWMGGNAYEIGEKKYGDAPWDSATWNLFEEHAGKKVSIVHFGQPAPWNQAFAESPLNLTRERGAIPLMDMDPDGVTLKEIVEGKKDSDFTTWAKQVRNWASPLLFRWTWEMNGTWFQWGKEAASNPTLYKEAWWHLHKLFEEQGATNITWVWCPNLSFSGSTSLSSLYPGNEYVDWTCLDGYNWGTNPVQPDSWKSFATLFRSSYNELVSLAPNKPVVIGETASTEYGGSKASWIADAIGTQIPKNFANLKAVVWFNKWESGRDWPIETSASSETAFRSAIANPIYSENTFGSLPELTKVEPLP